MSSEKAKVRAIDLAIELVADDLLKSLLSLDWHARIASIENDKIYLNAGRLSGLEKGDILEVYAPGPRLSTRRPIYPSAGPRERTKGKSRLLRSSGLMPPGQRPSKDIFLCPDRSRLSEEEMTPVSPLSLAGPACWPGTLSLSRQVNPDGTLQKAIEKNSLLL